MAFISSSLRKKLFFCTPKRFFLLPNNDNKRIYRTWVHFTFSRGFSIALYCDAQAAILNSHREASCEYQSWLLSPKKSFKDFRSEIQLLCQTACLWTRQQHQRQRCEHRNILYSRRAIRLLNWMRYLSWCYTHNLMSSSGRFSGTAVRSEPRQTRITSSDVPEHEQPFAFHGRQISLSVFPKSPYCFKASSYNRLASLSASSEGMTNVSCIRTLSANLAVCSFDRTLHLVKLSSINATRTRWPREKLDRVFRVTWAITVFGSCQSVNFEPHSLIKQLSDTRQRHSDFDS